MPTIKYTIDLHDVSALDYAESLSANSLQGLVNRKGARLFPDYGVYDDPGTHTTNSVHLKRLSRISKERSKSPLFFVQLFMSSLL